MQMRIVHFLLIGIWYLLSCRYVFAKPSVEPSLSLVQAYPFIHGLLLISLAYTTLFYFLRVKKYLAYLSIFWGILSISLQVYTSYTVISLGLHALIISIITLLSWRLNKIIRPLQTVQDQNDVLSHILAGEQARLKAVVESTGDLIYSLDRDLRFITFNTATYTTFKGFYEKDIHVGDCYSDISAKQVFDMMQPNIKKAFAGDSVLSKMQYTMRGNTYYREVRINPIREANGEILSIAIFSKDITEAEMIAQTLRYSESLLEATFEQSPDALFLVDFDTFHINRCNTRALQLYEAYSEDLILGRHGFDFHKHQITANEQIEIKQFIRERGVWSGEYEYKTFKGNWFWGILKLSSLLLGNKSYILVRVSDISERKENEHKVVEKEANLRAILESNDQFIWLADETFTLIDHNQIFANMLMQTFGLQMLPHMNLVTSLPYIYQTMWKLRYKRILKGNRDTYIDAYEYKGREYVYQITGFPVYEEDQGVATRASLFARDITAQVMAERTLQDNQRLLASINQHLQDALFRSTPSGKLLYVNHGFFKMFGYKEEEVYEQDVRQFYENPADRIHLQELLNETQHYDDQECKMKRKDGSFFWGAISGTQSQDENGSIFYDGIIRDITQARQNKTQLKKQNKKLKKVNGELDKFVYSASHDLRAPLSSLLGLLDIARLSESEAERQQLLAMMTKSVKKLDAFIQQIIQYSRNSRVEVAPALIDFQEMIESIFDNLKYMPNSANIAHQLDFDIETPFYSDYFRLHVILSNLISNAFRYANPYIDKQFIKVLIHTSADKVHIAISDNGQGIKAEYLPHIFKMFYKANESNTGSGIGLYILKETLEVLKGKIYVDSIVGEGTTFSMDIPNLQQPQANL